MKPRTLRHMNWKSVTGSQLDSGAWLAPITAGSIGEPGRRLGPLEAAHVALRRGDQVVAAAEAGAVAGQRDRVHLRVEVGALDAGRDLGRHPRRDPVPPLGPVQCDASDPPIDLVGEGLHAD